ncbi:MAG: SDR family oxidoreductase, partial [Nakamurella sp.]
GEARFIACNVTSADSVEAMIADLLAELGRLDCACNNAGIELESGPLADATARQQVVVQETEIAKLEAARQEQRLNATVYKEADAAAYAKRVQAEATKSADISAAEASARKVELAATADARKVELAANAEATAAESRARATRTTGEAEAAATTARGAAAASAAKAMAVAEADGIEARANALSTNQDAVIAQQLAERMPEIVRAAAEPFAHVGQLTVLNGAEGLNGMVAGIMAQVGTLLPQLTNALGKKDQPPAPSTNGSRPVSKAVQDGQNAARNQQ